jgi:hypothetical protein
MMIKAKRWNAVVVVLVSVAGFSTGVHAGNWWETMKLKGDLRYRHEMLDKEGSSARNRQRLRARFGIFGDVSPYTKFGIQLATGSGDPVSTNQTLGDAFTVKRIGLDMAYFETTHPKLPGLKVTGGKFENPFFKPGKSELIWDSDWNPEGGVAVFEREVNNVSLTLLGAGLWIDERSTSNDSWLGAVQGVARVNFNEKKSSFAFGGSFYNYVNIKGYAPFYDPEDPAGNSTARFYVDGDTVLGYANDFDILEVFGEFTHHLNEVPLTVMADYAKNTKADSLQSGWLVGFHLGKTKKPGSWDLRYIYRKVKADAVVGRYTDSDFRGGGTDAKGHEIGGSIQLAENTVFNLTYFINEIGLDATDPQDFRRLQIDLQLKF